jgi:FolB domain-containing protein
MRSMLLDTMDKISIRDLLSRCYLGVGDREREEKQEVVIQIEVYVDLQKAAETDRLQDTVDYRSLQEQVTDKVEASRFHLLEALASFIADTCLEHHRVEAVRVQVEKPSALRFSRSAGVEIFRIRDKDASLAPRRA